MKRISILDRLILLAAAHVAGYMIIKGVDGYGFLPSLYLTTGFGAIILSCLLLIIFGFDILGHRMVVVAATLIPLSVSLGLVSVYLPRFHTAWALFAAAGFAAVALTRILDAGRIATIALATVHGAAGLVIFALPIVLVARGSAPARLIMAGLGGGVMGLAGLLLAFLRMDRKILTEEGILSLLPLLLLATTTLFALGMR